MEGGDEWTAINAVVYIWNYAFHLLSGHERLLLPFLPKARKTLEAVASAVSPATVVCRCSHDLTEYTSGPACYRVTGSYRDGTLPGCRAGGATGRAGQA